MAASIPSVAVEADLVVSEIEIPRVVQVAFAKTLIPVARNGVVKQLMPVLCRDLRRRVRVEWQDVDGMWMGDEDSIAAHAVQEEQQSGTSVCLKVLVRNWVGVSESRREDGEECHTVVFLLQKLEFLRLKNSEEVNFAEHLSRLGAVAMSTAASESPIGKFTVVDVKQADGDSDDDDDGNDDDNDGDVQEQEQEVA